MRKRITVFTAVLLLMALLLPSAAAATLTTVETQFTYSTSNPAWLKDLIAREDMTNTQGTLTALTLTAKPEYPYSVTPEGFRTEVNYFVELYSLDENSSKAAYLYVLQYVNQFAAEATRNVSDEFIMEYLTDLGISYPQGGLGDYENLIFARALYTLLSSGAVDITITPGMSVQAALIQCMTQIFSIDASALAACGAGTVDTIDEYLLVACKIALNTNGYTVSSSTPDEEVYRLIAVMMVRQLGIAIDAENASFDELKLKYLAALLGQQYDISLDPDQLQTALNNNEVPFYILQIMGRSASLTIRSGTSYSEAFTTVAANTDFFALEEGEFYADIANYEAHLSYLRDRIWVCPQAYRTSTATETVMIEIGGELVASGSYVECPLDTTRSVQDIAITVTYQSAEQTVSETYTITVYQGSEEAPQNSQNGIIGGSNSGDSLIGIVGNNLVNTLGNTFYSVSTDLPQRVTNILTLMVPDINTGSSSGSTAAGTTGGSDYLSQLMYTASGGITGTPTVNTNTNTTIGSTGLSGVGGLNTSGSTDLGVSFSGSGGGQSLTITASAEGTPMLLSEAGDPPEGYEYLTNDEGYITGITAIKRHVSADNISSSDLSASLRGSGILWILLPMAAAAVVIAVVLLVRAKEKKANKTG